MESLYLAIFCLVAALCHGNTSAAFKEGLQYVSDMNVLNFWQMRSAVTSAAQKIHVSDDQIWSLPRGDGF